MRNLPEIPIRSFGAAVSAQIGVSAERRKALRAAGLLEPDPIHVSLLIDTGATSSWIRSAYLKKLGIFQPRSWFDLVTIAGVEEKVPAYGGQSHSWWQHGASPTRDLLGAVEAAGIEVSGTDKINTLSVLLSKSEAFQSDRKIGWSLKAPHKESTPRGAQPPAGSDVGSSQSVPDKGQPERQPGFDLA